MATKKHLRQRRARTAPGERSTRIVAWLLCVVTFPLLWIGGLVTTTKSGMAVPDWPGTYGYNLFLYPLSSWLYGPWDLFIEHGHRLLASLAGLLTIGLMVLLLRYDQRGWMRTVGVLALVGVVAQGVLGGLRVVLDERLLAMLHGSIGPLFFVLTVAAVVWTSRTWLAANEASANASLARLTSISLVGCALVYVQMILGAVLRHMPVSATPQMFATAVKAHLILAGVVGLISLLVGWIASGRNQPTVLRYFGMGVAGVVSVQLALGLATWLTKYGTPAWAVPLVGSGKQGALADGWWQAHVVTAHQATGSLLLASTLVVCLFAWRYAPAMVPMNSLQSQPAAPEGAATA